MSGELLRGDLRIAFVVGRLFSEASGVTRIMCDSANALCRHGTRVNLYAAEHRDGPPPGAHLLKPPARFVSEPGKWLGGLSRSPALRDRIERDADAIDVFHLHSLWMFPNHYASRAAARRGKPVVFTAHGALEPWAIRRSRWKKLPVAWWWQNRDLDEAACIHVNTSAEIAGVRAYGLTNPIAVIPNGVDLAPFDTSANRDSFLGNYLIPPGKRIVLFLSRLHEKKGLAHLIEAWDRATNDHSDWHLVLAGPDDGFQHAARASVTELKLDDSVTFTGPLQGERKYAAFAAADAFALPSFSEGFAMAILEAMAARLPVLITPGCNFPEVAHANAGVEVQPTVDDTERGLRLLMSMSDDDRRAMGARARALIERSYTWDAVAVKTIELYNWLLGRSSTKPAFVVE